VGTKSGAELASYYQRSDVFVFPSRTDTFGLVLLEAMACGTPVAAFPVRGPVDVVKDPSAGVLHEDLGEAALQALLLDRGEVRRYAERFSWERSARQFASHLVPASRRADAAPFGAIADGPTVVP
jgi:glycosyltransferase involved in cell wall biosynthesis